MGTLTLGFDDDKNDDTTPDVREADLSTIDAGDGYATAVLDIQFVDLTGVESVEVGTASCDLDTNTHVASCDLNIGEIDDAVADIVWDTTAVTTDLVAVQTPTATLTVTSAAGFTVPGISGSFNLAPITHDDGVTARTPIDAGTNSANFFPWTNLRSTAIGTQSNFRITGMGSDLSAEGECIFVTVSSTNGALPDGNEACLSADSVTIVADGVTDNRWTATFNSTAVADALGVTTEALNGDVRFSVVMDDDLGNVPGEITRLLLKAGVVTGTGFDGN